MWKPPVQYLLQPTQCFKSVNSAQVHIDLTFLFGIVNVLKLYLHPNTYNDAEIAAEVMHSLLSAKSVSPPGNIEIGIVVMIV